MVAVKVEVHVAEAVVPAKVHVVNDPVTPVWVRAMVPVGVVALVLVTVTVQVDPWLATTGVMQETVVDVLAAGVFTTTLVVPLLEL